MIKIRFYGANECGPGKSVGERSKLADRVSGNWWQKAGKQLRCLYEFYLDLKGVWFERATYALSKAVAANSLVCGELGGVLLCGSRAFFTHCNLFSVKLISANKM